jgi:hypothetical protein
MMIPPSLVYLKIGRWKRMSILPVFLLWPLALLFAPIVILVSIVYALWTRRTRFLTSTGKLYALLCSLKGLNIDVKDRDDSIFISIK